MDEEIKSDEITACPTCGHAVVVRGSITRYFVPVSDSKLKEIENVSSRLPEQIQSETPRV